MTYDAHFNFGVATVGVAPSPQTTGTTIGIANSIASRFRDPVTVGAYDVTIVAANQTALDTNSEIVRFTAKGAADSAGTGYTQFTIVRAQRESNARSIQVGDRIELGPLAHWFTDMEGEIARKQYKTVVTVGTTDANFLTGSYANGGLALQAALNSLPSTGGHVHIKDGTFNFSAPVVIPNPYTRISGSGMATILRWASNTNPSNVGLIQTKSYCIIENLRINGNSFSNTGGHGIYVYESSRVWIDRLYISDCAESAIYAEGTSSSTSSHANKYTNIYVLNCGGKGYWGKGFTYDCQFTNFWVGTSGTGMRVEDSNNFLDSVHLWENAGSGLELRNSDTKVVNSYFETNLGKGVDLLNAYNNVFTACNIRGNLSNGVILTTSNRVIISDSYIFNNGGAGINTSGTLQDVKIDNNIFYDAQATKTQTYGISLSSGSSNFDITNNTMRTSAHLTGSLLYNGTGHNIHNNIGVNPETVSDLGTVSTTLNLDRRNARTITATLTNATTATATFFGGIKNDQLTVVITQSSAGTGLITWPSNAKLAEGGLPLSTTGNAVDVVNFMYDGTNWREISRALSDATATPISRNYMYLQDDFLGGANTSSGNIGGLGWGFGTTNSATGHTGTQYNVIEVGHPGMYRLTTATSAAAATRIVLSSIMMSDLAYFAYIIRPASVDADTQVRCGLSNSTTTSGEAAQGIYFSYLPASSANWRTVTRDASGVTANSSTLAVTLNNWYFLEVLRSGSTVQFYINTTLVATHTTNVPSNAGAPMFVVESATTTVKSADIDSFALKTINPLGQRWT